jgi:hypothetical protein
MKKLVVLFLLSVTLFGCRGPAQTTTVQCPAKGPGLFTVAAPPGWKVTSAVSDDDYITLENSDGAAMYLRVMPDSRELSLVENKEYLNETYTSVQLTEPEDIQINGLAASIRRGSGKSKEDSSEVVFAMSWIKLPGGKEAEVWFEAPKENTNTLQQLEEIQRSVTAIK